MADDAGYSSEDSSPVHCRSTSRLSAHLNFLDLNGFFERSTRMEAAEVPMHRTLSRVASREQLERKESENSAASTDSNVLSRTNSDAGPTWWRESELPVARKVRQRSQRDTFTRLHSRDALTRLSSAPVVEDWPAVDDDVLASSKKELLSFTLDPTSHPADVLCHLAMEMFVSAGLPAGLAEGRVRRFILAVRASMLDNPYHNFYHVFDVMQTTNALATSTGTMARLDAWERFALLSAALW
jgi:hypothetical protein